MARIRTIKPELLEDEKAAALGHLEWRVFVSAILLADDYGNFRAHPDRVRAACLWMHPEADVASALERLVKVGLVQLYEVGGQRYAHLTGWEKHQKVDRPGKPTCPQFARLSRDTRETHDQPPRDTRGTLATDQDQDQDLDLDRDREGTRDSQLTPETRAETAPGPPGQPTTTITVRTSHGSEKTRLAPITAEMVRILEGEFPDVDVPFEIAAARDWALMQVPKPQLGKLWGDPMLGLRSWMRKTTRDIRSGKHPPREKTAAERATAERAARERRAELVAKLLGPTEDPEALERFEKARLGSAGLTDQKEPRP